jgi:hypothetical protein
MRPVVAVLRFGCVALRGCWVGAGAGASAPGTLAASRAARIHLVLTLPERMAAAVIASLSSAGIVKRSSGI